MNYKSQIGQDRWVLETLDFKRKGFFLDIGAFDGVEISNTYVMEKNFGWDGICIEAGKENFNKLFKNRDAISLNYAIWDEDGYVNFTENHTVGRVGHGDYVRSITFPRLLRNYVLPKIIDYISLDVEGAELTALLLFPFKQYHVNCWTIEHNSHEDEGVMRDSIRSLMYRNGYLLIDSGHSFEDWYVNKQLYKSSQGG